MNLRFFKENLFDLVFPKFCLGCGQEGIWICPQCQDKIVQVSSQVCPECGRISRSGKFCKHCQKSKRLSGIIVACYWEEGPIKEIIHNFKYNNVLELSDFLGGLMAEALKENIQTIADYSNHILITAVPLYWLRRAQRGFNQSEMLAEAIAEKLSLPKNFKILKKIRRTKPQAQTDSKKRRENLQNSFKFYKNITVRGRTIIIVDDVTTTGTTLNECARVLRKAGAKEVWGLVIARG